MKPKLIIKSFSTFGLNTYETKSYLSLLEKDSLSAVEVAKISGVPRGRVYEILENLLAKGFCLSIPGKVKKYKAVNPTVFQERIQPKLKVVESEIDQKKRELDSIKKDTNEIIESLVPLYNASRSKSEPLEYIEIIKDLYQIRRKYLQLCREAKEEVLAFSKPPYGGGPRKGLEEQAQQEPPKGRRTRAIYEIPKDKEEIEWLFKCIISVSASHGEEVRVLKELPMKMAIFDSKIVLLVLEDPISKQTSLTTQIIEHRSLAKGLKMLFEMLWEQAEDFHILQD